MPDFVSGRVDSPVSAHSGPLTGLYHSPLLASTARQSHRDQPSPDAHPIPMVRIPRIPRMCDDLVNDMSMCIMCSLAVLYNGRDAWRKRRLSERKKRKKRRCMSLRTRVSPSADSRMLHSTLRCAGGRSEGPLMFSLSRTGSLQT